MVESWVIITGIIAAYLIICLLMGFYSYFHMKRMGETRSEFFVCGRSIGFVVLFLTIVATYHSAFAFLGGAGWFYAKGISFWACGSWCIMTGMITYLWGYRIYELGKKYNYMSQADLFGDYYESEAVRVLVAIIMLVFVLFYIQVQCMAFGYIMNVGTGGHISFEMGVLIMMSVAAIYVFLGGLRAVYWTAALQGVWMFVSIWAAGIAIAYKGFGGIGNLFSAVINEKPALLTLPGPGNIGYAMWFSFLVTLAFGVCIQPHMFIKYYTAKSGKVLKWLGALTPVYLILLYVPIALLGLGGAILVPGLARPDAVIPTLMVKYMPVWFTGLILAGGIAATMSTMGSMIQVNSTILARDLYERYRPGKSERHYVWFARGMVPALFVVAYALTRLNPGYLVYIVTVAGAGAVQAVPALLGVIYPTKNFKMTKWGAITGMMVGIIVCVLCLFVWEHPLGLHAGVWGLIFNIPLTLIVSAFTKPPSEDTIERIHGYLEKVIYKGGMAEKEGMDEKEGIIHEH